MWVFPGCNVIPVSVLKLEVCEADSSSASAPSVHKWYLIVTVLTTLVSSVSLLINSLFQIPCSGSVPSLLCRSDAEQPWINYWTLCGLHPHTGSSFILLQSLSVSDHTLPSYSWLWPLTLPNGPSMFCVRSMFSVTESIMWWSFFTKTILWHFACLFFWFIQ